jgi:hypothetical protein
MDKEKISLFMIFRWFSGKNEKAGPLLHRQPSINAPLTSDYSINRLSPITRSSPPNRLSLH